MSVLLLNCIEKVLGKGDITRGTNYQFKCVNPNCHSHTKNKKKLELDIKSINGVNTWHCWSCGLKGKSIYSLFKYKDVTELQYQELSQYVNRPTRNKVVTPKKSDLKLPREFIFLGSEYESEMSKYAKSYLKSRGITPLEIYRYHIGICETGYYKNRIIFPSYDENNSLNNLSARLLYDSNIEPSYMKPSNIDENYNIHFENLLDFSKPIYICEGAFDAITIGDNATPLLGKNISNRLLEKIYDFNTDVYVVLDDDAIKTSYNICKKISSMGNIVRLVELHGKDPSSLGHKNVHEAIKKSNIFDMREKIRLKQNYPIIINKSRDSNS